MVYMFKSKTILDSFMKADYPAYQNFLLQSRSSRFLYWTTLCILLIILAYPLKIDTVPPLLDYPIHLARSYITIQYQYDPILRQIFEIDWRPIPNLASDIILFFLGRLFEIETAGRLLLLICLVITVLGVMCLHRVNFGYWGWWPLLTVIPAYHGALTAGFINYSIGIALMPLFLALSKMLRQHQLGYQIIANSCSALILYFCHVISTGLFGIFLLGCKLWDFSKMTASNRKKRKVNLAALILPFILPAILYINHSLSEVFEREDPSIIGAWDLNARVRGLAMPFMSGEYVLDFICLFFFILLFGFLMTTRRLAVDSSLLIGISIATVLFFVLPSRLLDAAFITDRLPIAITLIIIASTNPLRIKNRHAALIAALVLVMVVGRASSITTSWTESSEYYLRLEKAARMVERGSAVMILSPMTGVGDKGFSFWHEIRMTSPNWHFALLNVPALHAFSVIPLTKRAVFSQLHFVWADKQILSLAEPYKDLDFGDGGNSTWAPESIFMRNRLETAGLPNPAERFDYVLITYADRLAPKLRHEIESQSPLYVDRELILLRLPPPSYR